MSAMTQILWGVSYIKRTYGPEGFCEEDEDPQKIFAKYDAGPKSVTTRPAQEKERPA